MPVEHARDGRVTIKRLAVRTWKQSSSSCSVTWSKGARLSLMPALFTTTCTLYWLVH